MSESRDDDEGDEDGQDNEDLEDNDDYFFGGYDHFDPICPLFW